MPSPKTQFIPPPRVIHIILWQTFVGTWRTACRIEQAEDKLNGVSQFDRKRLIFVTCKRCIQTSVYKPEIVYSKWSATR